MIKKTLSTKLRPPCLTPSQLPYPNKFPKLSKTSKMKILPEADNQQQKRPRVPSVSLTPWKNECLTYVSGVKRNFLNDIPICGFTGSTEYILSTKITVITQTKQFCDAFLGGLVLGLFRNIKELLVSPAAKFLKNGCATYEKKMNRHFCSDYFVQSIFNFLKKKTKNSKKVKSEICSPSSKTSPTNQENTHHQISQVKPRVPARGDLGFDPVLATINHPAALKKTVPSHTFAITAQDPVNESNTHYSNAKSMSKPDAAVKPKWSNVLLMNEKQRDSWLDYYLHEFFKEMNQKNLQTTN